jgi:hypothetical protein
VYRRDSIDATHYPVFHQMEGVRIYAPADWEAAGLEPTAFAERELKGALEVRMWREEGAAEGPAVCLVPWLAVLHYQQAACCQF